jgi:transposase
MSKSYSMDLRSRVVAAVEGGSSRREAARRFGISPSCAVKLLARVRATGSAEPGRRGRRAGSGKLGRFEANVIAWVKEKPDLTLPELARRLEQTHGVKVHPSALSRLLGRTGWTYKKIAGRGGDRAGRRRQAAPALVSLAAPLALPAAEPIGVPR